MKPGILAKQTLITTLAKLSTDESTWKHIKDVVTQLESTELSGASKKALAITELQKIGIEVLSWIQRLVFELAVAWIKLQVAKNSK